VKHWALNKEESGIAVAVLDKVGESANSLSADVLAEFSEILDCLALYPPTGLIIRSGKAAGFIAGADIQEFTQLDTPEKGRALVERGWTVFNRLAAVPYPTLALVRGHCLGGGLELALACRYLLAVEEPGTKMALPEVMLGIFPGWGGMLRLPQRVGPSIALDLMLTGKSIDAKRAQKIGLADACVLPEEKEAKAYSLLLSGQRRRALPLIQRLLNGPLKFIAARAARQQVAKKARPEHYPAPYAIIDLWAKHGGNALAAPAIVERIISSPTARNLVRVYFLQERLKSFGKDWPFKASRVHVIGCGEIAAWCALRGLTVSLQDLSQDRLTQAIEKAGRFLEMKLRDPATLVAAKARLMPDLAGNGIADADVVIEATTESLEGKQALLQAIAPRMKPGALLATNTASLRLEDLANVLPQPQRLVGIHFVEPLAITPLVEVAATEQTDPQVLSAACTFVRQIDKLPLPLKSSPGLLVDAVLQAYLQEALRMVEEGVAPETVDAAMLAFGMSVGPFALIDRMGRDHPLLRPLESPRIEKAPADIAARLLKALVERIELLVAEGVVADADLADAGVIFATGFAPFTGGPLNYSRAKNK
jgi:3-hydroxyacyl-CoA dehydrogenase/enoyl-CoA hydratase/3-hydroxybutyryl-CoA epimerase